MVVLLTHLAFSNKYNLSTITVVICKTASNYRSVFRFYILSCSLAINDLVKQFFEAFMRYRTAGHMYCLTADWCIHRPKCTHCFNFMFFLWDKYILNINNLQRLIRYIFQFLFTCVFSTVHMPPILIFSCVSASM